MSLPQISEAEFEVMKIVWKYAPINTNEITEKLTLTTSWSPKQFKLLSRDLFPKKLFPTKNKAGYLSILH